eukprot:m51a1_g10353 hypothetical protein (2034) ;mRNA; f:3532-16891
MSVNTEYVGLAIPLADLEFLQKNPDIMLLGHFISWLTNAAWWKWVRSRMNQKNIIKMAMAYKCTKKKKKKISTGHVEELPSSMSLSQINAQYKFSEITNISFSNIFGHVFECIIGVQAVVQQYVTAKKHDHSIIFEQEVPVIRYRSGSNALYLQLDHNHCIISILFIHVMEHYNFKLLTIMMPVLLIMYFGKAINKITMKNFFTKYMNAIDGIDPSILTLINNNLMAPTPHSCFCSHTNLSFLYLSMSCQMTCLKYIFSNNGTDITTNSTLTDLIDHWEQHFTEPLRQDERTPWPESFALTDLISCADTAAAMLTSARGVGDLDGDGASDLAVGMHGVAGSAFGSVVAGAGDWNGDGTSDIAVGSDGALYVVSGRNLEASTSASETSTATPSTTSRWQRLPASPGRLFIVWGRAAATVPAGGVLAASDLTCLVGESAQERVWAVSTAGDFNGDGRPDVVVGAPRTAQFSWASAPRNGRAFIVLGGPHLRFHSNGSCLGLAQLEGQHLGLTISGGSLGPSLGTAVAGGDVNGDGLGDALIGNQEGSHSAFYVVFGASGARPALLPGGASVVIYDGSAEYGAVGFALDVAGDINGDGISDIVESSFEGESAVVFGRSTWPPSVDLQTLDGETGFRINGEGSAVAKGIGDYNGDSMADVAVLTSAEHWTVTDVTGSVTWSKNSNTLFLLMGNSPPSAPQLICTAQPTCCKAYLLAHYNCIINGSVFADQNDVINVSLTDWSARPSWLTLSGNRLDYLEQVTDSITVEYTDGAIAFIVMASWLAVVVFLTGCYTLWYQIRKAKSHSYLWSPLRKPVGREHRYQMYQGSKADYEFVRWRYKASPVPGMRVATVSVIYNPSVEDLFESRVKQLFERTKSAAFQPKWSQDSNSDLRGRVAERFQQLAQSEYHYPGLKFVPTWRPWSEALQAGLLSPTDGQAGKGFYHWLEASHCAGDPGVVGDGDGMDLVFVWSSVFSAFPVIGSDVCWLGGKGNYGNYDSHFAALSGEVGAEVVSFVLPRDTANLTLARRVAGAPASIGRALVGPYPGAHLGRSSLSNVGDVNGDALSDIAVSADPPQGSTRSRVYVVFGTRGALPRVAGVASLCDGVSGVVLEGNGPSFGFSVAGGADVDGDHVGDLVVGEPDAGSAFRENAGASHVFLGRRKWPQLVRTSDLRGPPAGFTVYGSQQGDRSGHSVALGDLTGDGYAEIIVGAPNASRGNVLGGGSVYVVKGTPDPPTSLSLAVDTLARWRGTRNYSAFGWSLCCANVTGDGTIEAVVGAFQSYSLIYKEGSELVAVSSSTWSMLGHVTQVSCSPSAARALVAAVPLDGREMNSVWLIGGAGADGYINRFPFSAAAVGNFAPPEDAGGEDSGSEGMFVGLSGQGVVRRVSWSLDNVMSGMAPDERFGHLVSTAGDHNGDEVHDIAISAPLALPDARGRVSVVYGNRAPVAFAKRLPRNVTLFLGQSLRLPYADLFFDSGPFELFTIAPYWAVVLDGSLLFRPNITHVGNWSARIWAEDPYGEATEALVFEFTVNETLQLECAAPQNLSIWSRTTRVACSLSTSASNTTLRLALEDTAAGSLSIQGLRTVWNAACRCWEVQLSSPNEDFVVLLRRSLTRTSAISLRVQALDSLGQKRTASVRTDFTVNIGAIVGGCVGGFAAVALLCGTALLWRLLRRADMALHRPHPWHCELSLRPPPGVQTYCLLPASDREAAFVRAAYHACPVPGMDIKSVATIYNPSQERLFEQRVAQLQGRAGKAEFEPAYATERLAGLRALVMQRLDEFTLPHRDPLYPGVRLLPAWHGTRAELMDSILKTGFANLATTDDGYFGKGLYASYEARYAHSVYSRGALLLGWVSLRSAYPVVDGDMAALQGGGVWQNYDCHFVPVRPASADPAETSFLPCTALEEAVYHEIVVFEAAQMLPRFVVQLGPAGEQRDAEAAATTEQPPQGFCVDGVAVSEKQWRAMARQGRNRRAQRAAEAPPALERAALEVLDVSPGPAAGLQGQQEAGAEGDDALPPMPPAASEQRQRQGSTMTQG